MAREYAGYGLNECNARDEVRKAGVPVLLIHGEADTFVQMCIRDSLGDGAVQTVHSRVNRGAGHGGHHGDGQYDRCQTLAKPCFTHLKPS